MCNLNTLRPIFTVDKFLNIIKAAANRDAYDYSDDESYTEPAVRLTDHAEIYIDNNYAKNYDNYKVIAFGGMAKLKVLKNDYGVQIPIIIIPKDHLDEIVKF